MPALTPAMGRPEDATFSNIASLNPTDMITIKNNGWGRDHFEYNDRWLHSDIKNMAYHYIKTMFETMKKTINKE